MVTRWTTTLNEFIFPLGNVPNWAVATPPMAPKLVAASVSPLGPNSIMERCEFYFQGSATLNGTGAMTDQFQLDAMSMMFAAEVYDSSSSTVPNPKTSTNASFVLTAAGQLRARSAGSIAGVEGSWIYSTPGYVTSVAKRGPAQYGSGATPALRVGVYTPNQYQFTWAGSANSSELYVLRTLWKA